ncbi:rCG63434 [Rattus norvegicus]|uniref:RCG63434 n=1 Tax=Rattus norvegicus TaxID=10116 RepID=A6HTN0_RAT|nr:rCG63434 [Rattus norvegicus]
MFGHSRGEHRMPVTFRTRNEPSTETGSQYRVRVHYRYRLNYVTHRSTEKSGYDCLYLKIKSLKIWLNNNENETEVTGGPLIQSDSCPHKIMNFGHIKRHWGYTCIEKEHVRPGMLIHACDSSIQETESGGIKSSRALSATY